MTAKTFVTLTLAFVAATLATAVAGAVVQTQFNIAAIEGLGHSVPTALRLSTTAEDLMRFSPVMAAIAAGAFLPAFAAAFPIAARWPALSLLVFAAAGVAGLLTAFSVMGFFTPMPTLVAAARGPAGLAALCATGALGGLVFARLSGAARG